MVWRINVLIPVHLPEWWTALAIERYSRHASSDITVIGIDLTPEQQKQLTDDTLPGFLLENAQAQEARGVSAHIIDCFSDPGLAKLSEVLRRPVIGVGQAGLWYAHGRFKRFAVITSERPTVDRILESAASWSLDSRLVGASPIGVPAGDVPGDPERAFEACLREARVFASEVEGLILGCTELAEFAKDLEARLVTEGFHIHVVNPIAVAIRLAGLRAMLESKEATSS